MSTKLRLSGRQHAELEGHLFPGDGLEAVAVALCGRGGDGVSELLLVHELLLVPHEECERHPDRVNWSPALMEAFLRRASKDGLAIVKVHSHPSGFDEFSSTDDDSDRLVFESVYGWVDGDRPHASAIMLPGGRMIARTVDPGGNFAPVDSVVVGGDDIKIFRPLESLETPGFAERHAQFFGAGTTDLLGTLSVAVVGCSGTGSPVVEQLTRLGVAELLLVDGDVVEERNLNRILGTTRLDADRRRSKVDVLAEHVEAVGLGTTVKRFPTPLEETTTLRAVTTADIVIGCMDSLSGRNVLSRLARYYLVPYFDVGVKLEALADGTINQVAGTVHYFQPDSGDFLSRGVFSAAALEAEDLFRSSPTEYEERFERGYVRGVQVDRPAVVSVNMLYAALVVNELLARLHPFRLDENSEFATTRMSLSHAQLEHFEDVPLPPRLLREVGRGDVEPPLGLSGLSRTTETP